jgi:hypothetical protein
MYQLNPEAAKAADSVGGRIAEKGKYIGTFTRAQHVVSEKGTRGVDFDFVSNSGQKARFSIYTLKADDTQIFGFKQLMAIMTVLGLRSLADPVSMKAKVYDFDAGQEVERIVPQFQELLGKPVGLLFIMEEYNPGKWRPYPAGIFQAATDLTASEILDRKTQPITLPKMVERLSDRPLRATTHTAPSAAPATATLADMDDDIPF